MHKARLLAGSVKRHIPDSVFVLCLVEREIIPEIGTSPDFDNIVLAKDVWEGDFDGFIFKHSIVEAATSVKGQFIRYLYKQFPDEQQFVYLDPDIFVYDDFVELKALLNKRPIVLCPHLLQPGNISMELSSVAHGVYNLGFLAVNRMADAVSFIDWWAERLSQYCYDDKASGIFTDQKWVSLAPCFFDVEILKHRGYDFATWSLLDCGMTENNGRCFVKGDPLRFIHFSGFGALLERCMDDWLPKGDHVFRRLYSDYEKLHKKSDGDSVSKTPWSYGSFFSGEPIENEVRIKYREHYYSPDNDLNPFGQSNADILRAPIKTGKKENPVGICKRVYRVIKYEGVKALFSKVRNKITR